MTSKRYEPDGNMEFCQCVRDHYTLIDNSIYQCRTSISNLEHNGLCEDCWEAHGKALVKATKK